jgi:hypothetical protein
VPFHHLTETVGGPASLLFIVAEWIARVYRIGKQYRVVVEGLLQFEVDQLDGAEERTAVAILSRLHQFLPPRTRGWEDPTAERVMEFEVAVRAST